jgi:hypothetical protein
VDKKQRQAFSDKGFRTIESTDPDFFSKMRDEFLASRPKSKAPGADKKTEALLNEYIAFIRKSLEQNPMTAFGFDERGTTIQFSDYSSMAFVSTKQANEKNMSVEVTGHRSSGSLNEFRQKDMSVQVTGIDHRSKRK